MTIFSRSEERIRQAAEQIEQETGHAPLWFVGDVCNPQDVKRIVQETVNARGGLDILVNNAGGPPAGGFEQFSDEDWLAAHERNLLSVVRFVRESLPHLKRSGAGSIINIVSISVKQPIKGLILSNTYRAGVIGLAKTLADELAPYGIRVNNLAPGRIATERIVQLDRFRAQEEKIPVEEVERQSIATIPMGRYGTPEEFAEVAAFLASDRASYVTGATLQVDGGSVRSIQ